MSSRVLLLSVGGQASEELVGPLEQRDLAVSIAHDANSALGRLGDYQLIILDAADEATLTLLCRRITDAGANHAPILAVAQERDVDVRVRLLEAGADDVVARPIDERELNAIVDALMLRASPGAQPTTDLPAAFQAPEPSGPGRVIAFAAAKGGAGTTTLAVNTAVALAEMAPGSVAIADLDLQHGQVATHLDIYGRTSTAELAREEYTGLGSDMLQESGRRHSSGLMVFGGPYRPDDGLDVTSQQLASLVDALRQEYRTVVVDVGSNFDARGLTVLERADRLCLVLTPDIPSLRLIHAALQVLSESGSATERATYVVNEPYPKPMIGPAQIEEHLGLKVDLQVAYDEAFVKAINEGQPLIIQSRRSPPATSIRRLADVLAGTASDVDDLQPQRRGLLRGLLGRS
jgi:pilus assembly protein CpaE